MGTTDGAVRKHKRTHAQKCTQPVRKLPDLPTGSTDINMKILIAMRHISEDYSNPKEEMFPLEGGRKQITTLVSDGKQELCL